MGVQKYKLSQWAVAMLFLWCISPLFSCFTFFFLLFFFILTWEQNCSRHNFNKTSFFLSFCLSFFFFFLFSFFFFYHQKKRNVIEHRPTSETYQSLSPSTFSSVNLHPNQSQTIITSKSITKNVFHDRLSTSVTNQVDEYFPQNV